MKDRKKKKSGRKQTFRWFDKDFVDSPASCGWGGLATHEGEAVISKGWEMTSPPWVSGYTLQEPNEGAWMHRNACRARVWCQWVTTETSNLVTPNTGHRGPDTCLYVCLWTYDSPKEIFKLFFSRSNQWHLATEIVLVLFVQILRYPSQTFAFSPNKIDVNSILFMVLTALEKINLIKYYSNFSKTVYMLLWLSRRTHC